jgi:hypothetical protein
MFVIGILIGIYSYLIFIVGLLGLLQKPVVVAVTIIFWLSAICIFRKPVQQFHIPDFKVIFRNRLRLLFMILLMLAFVVNLAGVLGPELAFDALWYHLTIPKIFLTEHTIRFLPGNLFYYSAMPKLTEMLYTAALSIGNEILAKIIHFVFGLMSCIVIYQVSRRYFSSVIALIAVIIFYSNLVVGWESITAYVDLARTFYETLAISSFLLWSGKHERKYLVLTGVMVGLAISTKLLAIGTIAIFSTLIILELRRKHVPLQNMARTIGLFILLSLSIPLPWFLFSFIHTGNPVYPFFTSLYDTSVSLSLVHPAIIIRDLWMIFTHAADPVSPVYLMFLPLLLLFYNRLPREIKLVGYYAGLALLIWYVTPRTGGGRFILPYLPAFSIITAAGIAAVKRKIPDTWLYRYLITLILIVVLVNIAFRAVANEKYLSVLTGRQSKTAFLSKQLHFSYGDFYDADRFFADTLTPRDKVLLYGFHNLFYADFPFLHETLAKKGDTFTYIAVQNAELPERFRNWNEIHYNAVTGVHVYSLGGQQWMY